MGPLAGEAQWEVSERAVLWRNGYSSMGPRLVLVRRLLWKLSLTPELSICLTLVSLPLLCISITKLPTHQVTWPRGACSRIRSLRSKLLWLLFLYKGYNSRYFVITENRLRSCKPLQHTVTNIAAERAGVWWLLSTGQPHCVYFLPLQLAISVLWLGINTKGRFYIKETGKCYKSGFPPRAGC